MWQLGSKIGTLRRLLANPDALREYLCVRYPTLEPTSRRVRWLFPAWWSYHLPFRPVRNNAPVRRGRFLVRVPKVTGIGDQVVTAWSETFLLARHLRLTFAHTPFRPNPHSGDIDWETFLGLGFGEVQAADLFRHRGLQVVYLPPLALNTVADQRALRRLIEDIYPQDGIIFHLGTGLYLNSQLDQAPVMPDVYRQKYWHARRTAPMHTNWSADELHVAVHVRRGDVVALKERKGAGWEQRWIDGTYYTRLLKALRDELPQRTRLHVYSDGSQVEVADLAVFPQTDFHLQQDPRQSFHELIVADVLVVSSSAFSLTAGKVSRGVKLANRNWDAADFRLYIPRTRDWFAVGADGSPSEDALSVIRGLKPASAGVIS